MNGDRKSCWWVLSPTNLTEVLLTILLQHKMYSRQPQNTKQKAGNQAPHTPITMKLVQVGPCICPDLALSIHSISTPGSSCGRIPRTNPLTNATHGKARRTAPNQTMRSPRSIRIKLCLWTQETPSNFIFKKNSKKWKGEKKHDKTKWF